MAEEKEGKEIVEYVASKAASQFESTETDIHEIAFTSAAKEISKAAGVIYDTQGFVEMLKEPSADTESQKILFYIKHNTLSLLS